MNLDDCTKRAAGKEKAGVAGIDKMTVEEFASRETNSWESSTRN